MKTIISFNKKFWNQRNLIFTDDPCINQIWMMANTKDEFFVTAFTVAESVGNYKKIKNPEKYFVDLLDKIFENQASKYFVRLVEQYDWTTNEFIKGGFFFFLFTKVILIPKWVLLIVAIICLKILTKEFSSLEKLVQ
jgi:monoamine oxidase